MLNIAQILVHLCSIVAGILYTIGLTGGAGESVPLGETQISGTVFARELDEWAREIEAEQTAAECQ